MPTYREFLAQIRAEVDEIQPEEAAALRDSATLIDVRESEEWDVEHIPGAVHVPRGRLESRIEQVARDRSRPVVVYCESGARSALATRTLEQLGYEDVRNLAGGIVEWKRRGLPLQAT